MKCTVCGGEMRRVTSDMPFKISDHAITVVKDLPILQCQNCPEYLLEDAVMERVDTILAETRHHEVDVVGFAA